LYISQKKFVPNKNKIMINYNSNSDYDCNSENEILFDILGENKNYKSPFENNKDFFKYKENNIITDYNSKGQISILNNNLSSNELGTNNYPNELDNDLNEGQNEANEQDTIYFITKKNNNEINENNRNENNILNLNENLSSNNTINNIILENNNHTNNNEINTNNNDNNNNDSNNNNNSNNNCGRNKLNSNKKWKHNKISEDNIINKIKAYFINTFIRLLLKMYSLNKNIDLKKLPTKGFISDLSKQNNERLFNMKIKDILCEQSISTKYSTFDRFENKKIIKKIYKENKEINVIKILELTFEELFIIFRRKLKDPEDMKKLEEIKAKIEGLDLLEENNKCKDVEDLIKEQEKDNGKEYIEEIKRLCLGYIKWFNDKNKRKSN